MSRILSGAVLLGSLATFAAPSVAQERTQVGTLTCNMGPSIGLIVGSRQRLACVFTSNTGARESYRGTITRVGLDLGVTAGGRLVWGVYTRTRGLAPRALAGTYAGASGDIALGLGVGANALVGGSNRTVSLQPLSVEGQAGVNLALGVAGFRLQ
jgi:hypothetical protein